MREEYFNQVLKNPKYLFHGSPILLEKVEKRLSHDSNYNAINIDNAVFVTSSIKIASAYAFKDKIKENSEGLKWNFIISSNDNLPIMTMENVIIDENIFGYIYVFKNNGDFKNEPIDSLQYKSYKDLIPIDIVKIYYKDFKEYYELKNYISPKTK
jgi:hypothetical protein